MTYFAVHTRIQARYAREGDTLVFRWNGAAFAREIRRRRTYPRPADGRQVVELTTANPFDDEGRDYAHVFVENAPIDVQRSITKAQLDALTDVATNDDARLEHRSTKTVDALLAARLIDWDLDCFVVTELGVDALKATGRDLYVRRAYGQNV